MNIWHDSEVKSLAYKEAVADEVQGGEAAIKVIQASLDNYVENFCR